MKHSINVRMKGQHQFKRYVVEEVSAWPALRAAIKETECEEAYYMEVVSNDTPLGYENSPTPGQPADLEGE